MAYRTRIVDDELDQLVAALPALAIEGPKAVGKTATAEQRARTVYRMDDPAQRAIAEADPRRLVTGDRPVLIDEWQRYPVSWDIVRRAVDNDATPGQFLLTGSAVPEQQPTHTGAGRISTVRMRPLSYAERGIEVPTVSLGAMLAGQRPDLAGTTGVTLTGYVQEILSSGFPGIRHLGGRALRTQLDGYIERIVEREFDEMGRSVRNKGALRRWMAAYAAASSTSASYETIRDAASSGEGEKPAKTTTQPYREVLERLWIIDDVPAWLPSKNQLKRLTQAPKHQLADPALAARLLGVDQQALLDAQDLGPPIPRDGTLLGALFESLVTLSVRTYAQAAEARVLHMRTFSGDREVDLIIDRGDGRVVAIEVKLAQVVDGKSVKHLLWLRDQIGDALLDAFVVTTGTDAYRRPDGIGVVPLALLGV